MKQLLVFLTIALCLCDVYANEPLWTKKERESQRDVLIEGEVQNVKKLHELKNHKWAEVWSADIKVSDVHKGEKKLREQIVSVLFTRGTIIEGTKVRHQRCPRHAELEKGDKAQFYIIKCTTVHLKMLELKETTEGALLIPGGSDVVKDALENKGQIPAPEERTAPETAQTDQEVDR